MSNNNNKSPNRNPPSSVLNRTIKNNNSPHKSSSSRNNSKQQSPKKVKLEEKISKDEITDDQIIAMARRLVVIQQAYEDFGNEIVNSRKFYYEELKMNIGLGELLLFLCDDVVEAIKYLHNHQYDFSNSIVYVILYEQYYAKNKEDFNKNLIEDHDLIKLLHEKGSIFTYRSWESIIQERTKNNRKIFTRLPDFFNDIASF